MTARVGGALTISTVALTLFTLVAFAANSIFCRLALMSQCIGALEFTLIRATIPPGSHLETG